jgi:hypothetical protein
MYVVSRRINGLIAGAGLNAILNSSFNKTNTNNKYSITRKSRISRI